MGRDDAFHKPWRSHVTGRSQHENPSVADAPSSFVPSSHTWQALCAFDVVRTMVSFLPPVSAPTSQPTAAPIASCALPCTANLHMVYLECSITVRAQLGDREHQVTSDDGCHVRAQCTGPVEPCMWRGVRRGEGSGEGSGARDLLEEDGAEAGVEATDEALLSQDFAGTADQAGGVLRVGHEANAGGLERAQEDVGDELGAGSGEQVDLGLLLPRGDLGKKSSVSTDVRAFQFLLRGTAQSG